MSKADALVAKLAERHQARKPGRFARPAEHLDKLVGMKRFVVTCALNNTPVVTDFWKSLQNYCAHNNAALLVQPVRYKNPTNREEAAGVDSYWWPDEVLPYLYENRIALHPHLIAMLDVPIQATAVNPLEGLEPFARDRCVLIGHPQLQLRAIPAPHLAVPKLIATTGTVSARQYSMTKAGARAEFHHTLGAQLVELDDEGNFHLRQLLAGEHGEIQDLTTIYYPNGKVGLDEPVAALITGDTHVWMLDPTVRKVHREMREQLRPPILVSHDVLDFYSGSHHHHRDPILRVAKTEHGYDEVFRELRETVNYLRESTPDFVTTHVVVSSNHHDHLYRWLNENDWRKDPKNARDYVRLLHLALENTKLGRAGPQPPDVFALWAQQALSDPRFRFLGPDESFRVLDIEMGMHGHLGPNGGRGSPRAFAQIAARSVTGHAHAPAIEKGNTRVGTSSFLRLGYNRGPSSWMHCDCVTYLTGKRTLLFTINGRWRA
jgi:hypothetical protein